MGGRARRGCSYGAVVKALASHQCGPGSIPRSGVICGLSLLVLYSEGLNGVNRQPSNGPKINRQPSKTEYFYRQPSNERAKISRQISQIFLSDRDRLIIIINNKLYLNTVATELMCFYKYSKKCIYTYIYI